MKNRIGLPSQRFLAEYTRRHIGPGSGLPVVTLAPADPDRLTCPFVTPSGCRVYPDRPSSCRTYPLMRIVRHSRDTAGRVEEYRLLREPHCQGFNSEHWQTVHGWIADQGIEEYNAENDRLMEVIRLKARLSSKVLPPSLAERVYSALYDLDGFKQRLHDGSLSGIPLERMEKAPADEVACLHLGLEWVKRLLEKALSR